MNIAEQIRNEVSIKDLPNFEQQVIERCKQYGYFSTICDRHIKEIGTGLYSVPYRYGSVIEKWGQENGFRVVYTHNSYGVRSIELHI